jgi:hypothetical protein
VGGCVGVGVGVCVGLGVDAHEKKIVLGCRI